MIDSVNTQTNLPLTKGQELLYYGQKIHADAPLYNMALSFHINGIINPTLFKKAFRILVQKNDALRLIFQEQGTTISQSIREDIPRDLEILKDIRDLGAAKVWLEKRTQHPFDLSACCYDSVLICLNNNSYIWYLNQHHLITDAWGVGVLFQHMTEIYSNVLIEKEQVQYPSYHQFIQAQAHNNSEKQEKGRTYWEKISSTLPPTPSILGSSNKDLTTAASRLKIKIGDQRIRQILEKIKKPELRSWSKHMSLFNYFASLYFALLNKISGQENLCIATPFHNRLSPEDKNTAGVFIELFPISVNIEEEDTFTDLTKKVRIAGSEYLKHAGPGYSNAAAINNTNAVLNYITAEYGNFGDLPCTSQWIHPGHCDARHEIRMQVYNFNDSEEIELELDLNNSAFSLLQKERIKNYLIKIIDASLEEADTSIDGIDILEETEKEQLLNLGNYYASKFAPPQKYPRIFSGNSPKIRSKYSPYRGRCKIDL